MARGGKREGAGRPAGAINGKTAERVSQIEASGLTPLDFMLQMLRDEGQSLENRQWAAEKAAPYVHAKLANVEMNANVNVSHEDALGELE